MMIHNLGYPRIGSHRELKKAAENYWAGKHSLDELRREGLKIRLQNWHLQREAGIGLIPCNDFSFYDHVLDTSLMTGVIPPRYHPLIEREHMGELDLYFAMARGYQQNSYDITALEMTKWFDTNYHYLVPEFTRAQKFRLCSDKIIREFQEAKQEGFSAKPVLLGPVSFLLLGKEKEKGFDRMDLIGNLLPVYLEVLRRLEEAGARYIQMDEPCFCLDLTDRLRNLYVSVYHQIRKAFPSLQLILTSYFGGYGANLDTALSLPVQTLHLDLVRCPGELVPVLASDAMRHKNLSLGVVDGRNIWKNDFSHSLGLIGKAVATLGAGRIMLAPSCSLLHVPCDLNLETDEAHLPPDIKQWMAFAAQKLGELAVLADLASETPSPHALSAYEENKRAMKSRRESPLVHRQQVSERVRALSEKDQQRNAAFPERKKMQQQKLGLPAYPTTTIGSFPQTAGARQWRAQLKKGTLSPEAYDGLIKKEIEEVIRWQEDLGLDVLVHGEFERNDMVEYFGEQLEGFVFTQYGWVQSYGSRCVKPPVIVGDVERKTPMTVAYTAYAQSLTPKPVKGMLTGPVTILQWSFVRNDQPRSETCLGIACAIRDEVDALEKAGIGVIQIDEPAIREGLPLRKAEWPEYLDWAVKAFRIASSGVRDDTQIHTHMCYSEFNDIIAHIAALDADVITIETSRSQMELLDAFAEFKYPNDIGPGVYDIHSPRVPSRAEMVALMRKAAQVIGAGQLWINPDCGLKTRGWKEAREALLVMMEAAGELRE